MGKRVAYIMFVLSWPVTLVHRAWNNSPVNVKSWFVYRPDVSQDFQWYIADTGNMLGLLFILLAIYVYLRWAHNSHGTIAILVLGLIFMQVLDIVNYWLFFKQNETILYFQGAILIFFLCFTLLFKNANHSHG